jgi:hypothetical protein
VYIYEQNIRAIKYGKQMARQLKREVSSCTIIEGVFNTLLSIMDGTTKEMIKKHRELEKYTSTGSNRYVLNTAPNISMHTFFKYAWRILCDRSYVRTHNTSQ